MAGRREGWKAGEEQARRTGRRESKPRASPQLESQFRKPPSTGRRSGGWEGSSARLGRMIQSSAYLQTRRPGPPIFPPRPEGCCTRGRRTHTSYPPVPTHLHTRSHTPPSAQRLLPARHGRARPLSLGPPAPRSCFGPGLDGAGPGAGARARTRGHTRPVASAPSGTGAWTPAGWAGRHGRACEQGPRGGAPRGD